MRDVGPINERPALVRLTSAPAVEDVQGGCVVACEGEVLPFRKAIKVIIPTETDLQLGDCVLADCLAGVAYARSRIGVDATDDGGGTKHRVIQPRPGGEVRAGAREGGAWASVALFQRMHDEIVNLRLQIVTLSGRVDTITSSTPGAGASSAVNAVVIAGGITGGDAATLKSRTS